MNEKLSLEKNYGISIFLEFQVLIIKRQRNTRLLAKKAI